MAETGRGGDVQGTDRNPREVTETGGGVIKGWSKGGSKRSKAQETLSGGEGVVKRDNATGHAERREKK